SPSSTRGSRSATRRAYRRPGSVGVQAATRSITRTRIPRHGNCSRRNWPSTGSRRRWTRPMRRISREATVKVPPPRRRNMHDVPGQTHGQEPAYGQRAGFGKFGRPKTPYDSFMESEGVPVFRDIGVSKVQNLPLAPWKRTGGRGTYIQLYGTEGKWG